MGFRIPPLLIPSSPLALYAVTPPLDEKLDIVNRTITAELRRVVMMVDLESETANDDDYTLIKKEKQQQEEEEDDDLLLTTTTTSSIIGNGRKRSRKAAAVGVDNYDIIGHVKKRIKLSKKAAAVAATAAAAAILKEEQWTFNINKRTYFNNDRPVGTSKEFDPGLDYRYCFESGIKSPMTDGLIRNWQLANQMHMCTFSCHKKQKLNAAGQLECRFGFPIEETSFKGARIPKGAWRKGAVMANMKDKKNRERSRILPRRNNGHINNHALSPLICLASRGNHDLGFVDNDKGAPEYCAKYSSKADVAESVELRNLITRKLSYQLSTLDDVENEDDKKIQLRRKFKTILDTVVGAEQIGSVHACTVLLNLKFVKTTRIVVKINPLKVDDIRMQALNLNASDYLQLDPEAIAMASNAPNTVRGLRLAFVKMCKKFCMGDDKQLPPDWEATKNVSFYAFSTAYTVFKITKTINPNSKVLFNVCPPRFNVDPDTGFITNAVTFILDDIYYRKRKTMAVMRASPNIKIDEEDEKSAYMILLFFSNWGPFGEENILNVTNGESVALLDEDIDHGDNAGDDHHDHHAPPPTAAAAAATPAPLVAAGCNASTIAAAEATTAARHAGGACDDSSSTDSDSDSDSESGSAAASSRCEYSTDSDSASETLLHHTATTADVGVGDDGDATGRAATPAAAGAGGGNDGDSDFEYCESSAAAEDDSGTEDSNSIATAHHDADGGADNVDAAVVGTTAAASSSTAGAAVVVATPTLVGPKRLTAVEKLKQLFSEEILGNWVVKYCARVGKSEKIMDDTDEPIILKPGEHDGGGDELDLDSIANCSDCDPAGDNDMGDCDDFDCDEVNASLWEIKNMEGSMNEDVNTLDKPGYFYSFLSTNPIRMSHYQNFIANKKKEFKSVADSNILDDVGYNQQKIDGIIRPHTKSEKELN